MKYTTTLSYNTLCRKNLKKKIYSERIYTPHIYTMDLASISHADFKNRLKEYLIVLACKFVDDESSFIKHLHKQANSLNASAMNQLAVIKQFENLSQQIHKRISDFAVLGYQRISRVCLAIISEPELPFNVSHDWAICALSGINTNHSCVVKNADQTFHIDFYFAPFASMLWLVTHMSEMEYSRINSFLNESNPGDSIKQIMQKYLETDTFQEDEIIDMYHTAFKTVYTVFDNTIQQIEGEVCKHPEHAVRV